VIFLKKEIKEKNNKKKLLVVLGISVLTVLGSAVAYFTTSTDITNLFKAALYQNEIVEEFVSPDNWTPGTTTDKTIKVTNTGSINMAVRVSYTEEWVTSNGNKLSLSDSNGNVASIINFNEGWTKNSDGYYYYGSKENMTKVKPGDTTTSFMSGVTFNSNIQSSLKETKSADGKTITYTSTGDGYDNATYSLTVKIDTIQYDQSKIW
jgi:hypothetical protein